LKRLEKEARQQEFARLTAPRDGGELSEAEANRVKELTKLMVS